MRSFMVMVQRGHDQLKDMLQWVGGEVSKSQHQPSDSNWSGIHMLVGSIPTLIINFSHFSICKIAQRYCCVSLMGNQDLAPRLHYCFS